MSRHAGSAVVHGHRPRRSHLIVARVGSASALAPPRRTARIYAFAPVGSRAVFERVVPSLLAEVLTEPTVRILDLRRLPPWLPSPYSSGHVPGASWFDVDSVLDVSLRNPRSLLEFAAAMALHGVGDEQVVVLYDEDEHSAAPALARAMVEFGHRTVAVLAGGWEGWVAAGYPVDRTTREYPPASFTARQGSSQ